MAELRDLLDAMDSLSDVFSMTRPRIVICSNTAWSLYNFRRRLISALVDDGYEIVAVAPSDDYSSRLPELGCRYVALEMDNKGTSPVRDLQLATRIYRLLKRERPVAYLGYTVKPNVYGAISARLLGVPTLCNITGLGTAFIKRSPMTTLVSGLYRAALAGAEVVFENSDDRDYFVKRKLVSHRQSRVMPTTGIDLEHFSAAPPRAEDGEIRFLLSARMLWDKGIGEFVEAARHLRRLIPNARFQLLGFVDVPNPTAIDSSLVEEWVQQGIVEYLGDTDDVRPFMAQADCVVLPSYREGLSRSLLEAAASARPIIATDVPGCREVVDRGVGGYLVPPRDSDALLEAMHRFCHLSVAERREMGRQGRVKMEASFNQEHVIDNYRQSIARLVRQG
jgi:glycosyltransferase involved in cell wall biosynthesis